MGIYIGIIVGVFVIGMSLFINFKNRDKNKKEIVKKDMNLVVNNNENSFPNIQIIENAEIVPLEKNKIVDEEIKNAITILDNYAPKGTVMAKNMKNASELLNDNRAFFSTSKKSASKMLEVKGTKNEFYGIQMKNSKVDKRKLFDKQTKLKKENSLIQASGKNALMNAGFNAASMVVGQYYMNEINNKLDTIQNEIKGISNFLDSEYQGTLMQIVSEMQEMIDNKVAILNNEFSRDKSYNKVRMLESDCARLLGQANELIKNDITNDNIDYKKYEEKTKLIHKWFVRQQILQQLLLEIGNLRYILANGNETSKLSHAQYNNYLKQTNNISSELEKWHEINCEKFGIDKIKHKRKASLFEIRKNTIGRINEDWAYQKIEKNMQNIINKQTNIKTLQPYTKNNQCDDIKIQKYNGEYYNLPNSNNET